MNWPNSTAKGKKSYKLNWNIRAQALITCSKVRVSDRIMEWQTGQNQYAPEIEGQLASFTIVYLYKKEIFWIIL